MRDVYSAVSFVVLRLLRSRASQQPQGEYNERTRMIRNLFVEGMTPRAIAARYGITDKRHVIAHCIQDSGAEPMVVEWYKVNLWPESLEPGRPLSVSSTTAASATTAVPGLKGRYCPRSPAMALSLTTRLWNVTDLLRFPAPRHT